MRSGVFALLCVAAPAFVAAQDTSAARSLFQSLPGDVRRDVVARWNGTNALRASERTEVNAGSDVQGNVAVLRGPLVIAGHVTGNVLAINADVLLRSTARIDGDLLVVGGDVDGRNTAHVGGSIRIYHQSLQYREEGGRLIATSTDSSDGESWWHRFERRPEGTWAEALRVVQAGPYNRVEGLPIELGPALHHTTPWGSVQLNTAAIVRTGSFNSSHGDVGNDLRGEMRFGPDSGTSIAVGARAFDVVEPVERWELTDLEVALASFLARRDYRDYYTRHGGGGYVSVYGTDGFNVTGSFAEERWSSRALRNPFTLFDDDRPWRPSPTMDDALFHVLAATVRLDTRTDPDDPWSGWFLNAGAEHGQGYISSAGLSSDPVRSTGADGSTEYNRAMFDLRRYNRLGPDAQLNVRLVAGGRLGGDQLPLEKRFSVDGPGALPGFDFRSPRTGPDVGTCNEGTQDIPGRPAECDRILLAQVEYRSDLHMNFTGGWENWPRRFHSARGDIEWVVFADAGRGWKIGQPGNGIQYEAGTIPPLGTFRTDVGIGLDVAGIGIYAAKSASTPSEPVNFFVRLRHRF